MSTVEDENIDLKKKNNELAQKLQYWQMIAAERENEKLNLVKEINDLRLKLSNLRNVGANETRKLNAAIQLASGNAITSLVNATNEIAKTMEIAKAYVRDRQELEAQSPRWSTLSNTPTERKEKVHRVPPMVGGQSIQPVVALSRTLLNTSNPRLERQSPNRPVPLHMLPDVYIPLTRIDEPGMANNNMETDEDFNNPDDSTENLGLPDGDETLEESLQRSEDEEFTNRLHVLHEEDDESEDVPTPRLTLHIDNPLEGPSWLLDGPSDSRMNIPKVRVERNAGTPRQNIEENAQDANSVSVRLSCEFSPTVRRRKRTSSPLNTPPRQQQSFSSRPPSRKNHTNGPVLKVLVAKMRLDSDGETGSSPPKRARSPTRESLLTFDAPSPNGATDSGVIVSESRPCPSFDKEIKRDPCISLARLNLSRDIRESNKSSTQENIRNRSNSEESQQNISENNRLANNQANNRFKGNSQLINNDIGHNKSGVRHRVNSREDQIFHDTGPSDVQENISLNGLENELSNDSQHNRPIDTKVRNKKNRQESQHNDNSERNRSIETQVNVTRRTNGLQSQTTSSVIKQERDSVERTGISNHDSHDSRDSDSSGGPGGDSNCQSRSRRPRKMVTYKEKPLNSRLQKRRSFSIRLKLRR